jgi:hypothetical protein
MWGHLDGADIHTHYAVMLLRSEIGCAGDIGRQEGEVSEV